MSDYIKALDNVGAVCHADPNTFAKFEKMGFTLYPLGRQGVKVAGLFVKAGTGSVAAHFRDGGYFEMISIYSRLLPTGGYKKLLVTQGERLVKLTLELTDAKKEALRVKETGPLAGSVFGPMEFRRVFTSATQGKQDARFSIMGYPFPKDYPISVLGTEHLTPSITWQDDLLDHPNGARLLANALVAVDDIEEAASTYETILAQPFDREENDKRVCRFSNDSRLTLVSRSGLKSEFPEIDADSDPFVAAVYFGVSSLDRAREVLTRNEVPFESRHDQLVVPHTYVLNSTFVFEQTSG